MGCSGRSRAPRPTRAPPLTWTALAPLALPDLPEADRSPAGRGAPARRPAFWLPVRAAVGVRDRAERSRSRDTDLVGLRRYWRGPTWINAAWLVWLGLRAARLRRAGRGAGQAARAAASRRAACASTTTRTRRRAWGRSSFAWSTLAVEMIEPDPRAAQLPRASSSSPGTARDRGGVLVERALDVVLVAAPEARRSRRARPPARSARSAPGRASCPRP